MRGRHRGLVKLAGHGLMQQQQVDDIHSELASAFVKSVQGLIEPVVGDPDFSLQKDLVTGQPRVADRLTDCTFVVIRRCGVDHPVAHLKRPGHGSGSFIRRNLIDTEPKRRYRNTII